MINAQQHKPQPRLTGNEFSRGKPDLINAIFFADYRQRLLPSEAGRTTMCPTELRWDEGETPCLKLLPIETRATATTISEYKRIPAAWTVLPLDLDSPRKMAECFLQTVSTKTVSRKQAQELGLYHPDIEATAYMLNGDGNVEIPAWRHAVINFPHPLLKQGLLLLDTPGLNALGTEPELTLSMLPNAQAVLFVLAADTGVTRTDLEVWRHHALAARGGCSEGRLVLLNKIDYLWDELSNDNAIATAIARQAQETARSLGISKNQVLAVSARKGLLGKIKADHALIARSGLPPRGKPGLCPDTHQLSEYTRRALRPDQGADRLPQRRNARRSRRQNTPRHVRILDHAGPARGHEITVRRSTRRHGAGQQAGAAGARPGAFHLRALPQRTRAGPDQAGQLLAAAVSQPAAKTLRGGRGLPPQPDDDRDGAALS